MTGPVAEAALQREAQRQQALLQALFAPGGEGAPLAGWAREPVAAGLRAYRGNAAAAAGRALAAAYPTVALLLGDEPFAALARALWRASPPRAGDLALWGEALPGFIDADARQGDEPYLPDVARLDWALHRALSAADEPGGVPGLERLADSDPAALRLRPRDGAALVESAWPVVAIWQAHHGEAGDEEDRFAAAREALQAGRAEAAWVWRDGLRPRVAALAPADAAFCAALQRGETLAAALDAAGPGLDFSAWLQRALREGWLAAAEAAGTVAAGGAAR